MVDQNADYCPGCSLRQRNGQPRWWRIYRAITLEDDPVRQQYEDDLVPSKLSQLPPGYYEHVLDVYSLALVRNAVDGLPIDEPDVSVSGVADNPEFEGEDSDWLREQYPEIEERHLEEYPASSVIRD